MRSLVKAKNYKETLNRGEQLQREFPSDFELSELVGLARAEQAQIEQKKRLEEATHKIQEAAKAGRLLEAIQLAEKALAEFPKHPEILGLLDRAKKEHAEKERQALIKQRLRDVERMLDRQELTEAIDLARHTITTVGPDHRLSDTLQKAEKEREFREQKKQHQHETLQQAHTLLMQT